jgi:malate dehydrogenase
MDRVVVLGAGELGGLLAHALAKRAVAQEICLVDENGRVADGKALDIMQAAPIEGFAATVTGASDTALATLRAAVLEGEGWEERR